MVQKYGSDLGSAISVGTPQQRDAVSALGFGAGKPGHPGSGDILRPVDRRFRTIALDHQHVSVGKNVERSGMLEAGGKCMDLQSLRYRRRIFAPSDDFGDVYRRYEILLQLRQRGIGPDLSLWIAAIIIAAGESEPGDSDDERGERQLGRCVFGRVRHILCSNSKRFAKALSIQAVANKTTVTIAESIKPLGTTAVYPSR